MNIPVDTDLIVMAIWGLIFAIFVIKLFQSIRLVPTKS
ncbi:MAG: paraslipin, partial [Shewanella sp.]